MLAAHFSHACVFGHVGQLYKFNIHLYVRMCAGVILVRLTHIQYANT